MDLSKLSVRKTADEGATLHLRDPITNDPLYDGKKPVTITLRGTDSDALRAKVKEVEERKAKGEQIDELQAGAEKLASLIVGWSGIGLGSNEELPFTFENAVDLLKNPDAEWICEQIGPFSRSRRNFLKNRPTG